MGSVEGMIIRERLNVMCNSVEKILEHNLKKLRIKYGKSFRSKIRALEREVNSLAVDGVDMEKLVNNMLLLDDEWTFAKHGDFIVNVSEALCLKDGKTKVFDDEYMKKLEQIFTMVQKEQLIVGSTTRD